MSRLRHKNYIEPTISQRRRARIFVLYGSSVLAAAIEALLREQGFDVTGINVHRMSPSEGLGSFGAKDIVIVDTADEAVHPALSLLGVMLQNSDVVALVLDSHHNRMEVYRKQRKRVSTVEDLVKALGGSWSRWRRNWCLT